MTTTLKCRHRGPLVVDGEIELFGPDGERIDTTNRPRVLLCRCGASKSRPFCDGSHNRTSFEAPESTK